MIRIEYGREEILSAISHDILKSAASFLESYKKPTLLQYIGALSLLAHTSDKDRIDIENRLQTILREKILSGIYDELDKIPPVFPDIAKFDIVEIQRILQADMSANFLNEVSNRWQIITRKYNDISFYGITYLFQYLMELDLCNFEKWIASTTRQDFLIVFVDSILSDSPWKWIGIKLDNLDTSSIGILRAFYVLRKYRLDSHSLVYCDEKCITTLLTTRLSDRDKFIVLLKFIVHKYHGKKLQDLQFDTDLELLITTLLDIKYNFTKEELFAESPVYYSPIYLNIIGNMSDENTKQTCATYLFDKLFENLKTSDNNTTQMKVGYANILGQLSIIIGNVDILEKTILLECKELSFPYSFCKLNKSQDRLERLLYLLIALVIYKAQKKESAKGIWDMYLSVKSVHPIIMEINEADCYKQVVAGIEELLG